MGSYSTKHAQEASFDESTFDPSSVPISTHPNISFKFPYQIHIHTRIYIHASQSYQNVI